MENARQQPGALPWDPKCLQFPVRGDLANQPDEPAGAAWVWGKDDQLGRLNLLTPERVLHASSYVQTGEVIPLNLPLHVPTIFHRDVFQHNIKTLIPDLAFDDTYQMNTQSSTQWDGLRHAAHFASKKFYNGATAEDFIGRDATGHKCGMHHWANHGIVGRAVLLDYWAFAQANGVKYDPCSAYAISFSDLERCGKAQGIDIRPESKGGDIKVGDILLICSGFVDCYNRLSIESRAQLAQKPLDQQHFAGVAQEEAMVDWLHDCYFSAVAGDAPAFETWPPQAPDELEEKFYLHEHILALWGMPLGELWDLERLSDACKRTGRYTILLTSSPANVDGGVGSSANALAIM